MMKARPILFSAWSIARILAGQKTQTRRIMKPQPFQDGLRWEGNRFERIDQIGQAIFSDGTVVRCPYGLPGDMLWAKEGYQVHGHSSDCLVGEYLADNAYFNVEMTPQEMAKWEARKYPNRATPGRFMYKSLARIRRPVVTIRAERVQDISEEDARPEGVEPQFSHDDIHLPHYRAEFDHDPMPYKNYLWHGRIGSGITAKQSDAWQWQYSGYEDARGSFSSLWDSIHGTGAWERNDWCWCVEFEGKAGQ